MPKGYAHSPAVRAQVLEMRKAGRLLREIMAALDLPRSTVGAWLADPNGEKQRARREGYRGRCACGKPTDGSRGAANAPTRCIDCAAEAARLPADEHRRKHREQARKEYARRARKGNPRHTDPRKRAAYRAVERAIARGQLVRPETCERCGGGDDFGARRAYIDAHHRDYDEPLEVEWLCVACHLQEHADERASRPEPLRA